ncbi:MAG: hypothetical protein HZB72_11725 [Burkholderiales bacterium]|nr:hypothetical protein [Burkholderiales bacterium]
MPRRPRSPRSSRRATPSHHYISEKQLAALQGLQTGSIEERKARLRAKVIADMVYVRGGSFMRGDFARLLGIPGVTRITYNEDDKVVREITLSDSGSASTR